MPSRRSGSAIPTPDAPIPPETHLVHLLPWLRQRAVPSSAISSSPQNRRPTAVTPSSSSGGRTEAPPHRSSNPDELVAPFRPSHQLTAQPAISSVHSCRQQRTADSHGSPASKPRHHPGHSRSECRPIHLHPPTVRSSIQIAPYQQHLTARSR
ncbi:hypothetical protein ACLOJK_029392 [Asimina triloba]